MKGPIKGGMSRAGQGAGQEAGQGTLARGQAREQASGLAREQAKGQAKRQAWGRARGQPASFLRQPARARTTVTMLDPGQVAKWQKHSTGKAGATSSLQKKTGSMGRRDPRHKDLMAFTSRIRTLLGRA